MRAQRGQSVAVRAASPATRDRRAPRLGASRMRLIREALTESVLLALSAERLACSFQCGPSRRWPMASRRFFEVHPGWSRLGVNLNVMALLSLCRCWAGVFAGLAAVSFNKDDLNEV